MTFTFMAKKPANAKADVLLKWNSLTEDVSNDVIETASEASHSIWVTCSDKQSNVTKAKLMLSGMAKHLKFEEAVPAEIGNEFENSRTYTVSREVFVPADDNSDLLAKFFSIEL